MAPGGHSVGGLGVALVAELIGCGGNSTTGARDAGQERSQSSDRPTAGDTSDGDVAAGDDGPRDAPSDTGGADRLVAVDGAVDQASDGGGWCRKTYFPVGHVSWGIGVFDISGDGIPDLLAPEATFSGPTRLGVALGDGAGSFGAVAVLATEVDTRTFAAADFDGDGYSDVAALSYYGPLQLYRGLGNGQLAAAVRIQTTSGTAHEIVADDFNGDGKRDLAVGASEPGRIEVLLGQGNGTFAAPLTHAIGMQMSPFTVQGGDFDEDGRGDLLVLVASTSSYTIRRLLGQGDGTFSAQQLFSVVNPKDFTVGDVNKDGHQDLVATFDTNQLTVQLGLGDGTFSSVTGLRPNANAPAYYAVIADVSGDSLPDLLTGTSLSGTQHRISFLPGRGDGTFGDGLVMPIVNPSAIVTADLNRDGVADIVTPEEYGVAIYLGPCP